MACFAAKKAPCILSSCVSRRETVWQTLLPRKDIVDRLPSCADMRHCGKCYCRDAVCDSGCFVSAANAGRHTHLQLAAAPEMPYHCANGALPLPTRSAAASRPARSQLLSKSSKISVRCFQPKSLPRSLPSSSPADSHHATPLFRHTVVL